MISPNALIYGDNLDVLRRHVADESIDLVYLDPPFNSNANYNVLFGGKGAGRAAAQVQAFQDTWHWDTAASLAYQETVEAGGGASEALQAFKKLIGRNGGDMMAYLAMMAPRLVELRRVLKPTGSIYLHCDPTASHYLKVLMDAIFGTKNFRNEILWYYYNKMHDSRKKLFPRATDTILFYVKDVDSDFTFHQAMEQREKPVKQLLRKKVDGRLVNAKDEDGHVMYQLKTDRTIDNVWRIPALQPAAPERLGYPTQKPLALLERILQASSNPGDLVLDPFCGCGTTVAAAQKLDRRWLGIDITHLSINLMRTRLRDAFADAAKFKVYGEPTTADDAAALADLDKYQFQFWALGLVGARPASSDERKGADGGIDGRLYFHDEGAGGASKQIILSVKGGGVGVKDVRELSDVVRREEAHIGVLISLRETTRPMREEAANAGFYRSPWDGRDYPRVQLLTVAELLDHRGIQMPAAAQLNTTFQKAPRAAPAAGHQTTLPGT